MVSYFRSLLGLSSFLCFSALASEVQIIGIDIPGLHQQDQQGRYDRVIDKALVEPDLARLQVLPPASAFREFERCVNCCISPANLNSDFYFFGCDVVESRAMQTARVYIWTAPGQPDLNDLAQLQGKRVGIRHGMPYGRRFAEQLLNTIPVMEIEQNIRKLQLGRIDAFLAYTPDAYQAFNSLGLPPFPHDQKRPVAVHPDRLVCRGVAPEVIQRFNHYLDAHK